MNKNPFTFSSRHATEAIAICSLLLSLVGTCPAATLSWSGGGATDSWGDSANWGGVGTPATGDTVIFGAIATAHLASSNNVSGRILNQIRFQGASGGFTLYGQPISVTNNIAVTNTAGLNTISNAINVATADISVIVSNSASLKLAGQITGTVGVTKTGRGTLTYQGPTSNPYSGTTRVYDGTLQLNVGGISAFGGPLVIADDSGTASPTVQLLQNTEISDTAAITIYLNGTLDLNNYSETIGTSLTLHGATISSGSGTLTLSPNCNITMTSGSSYIYGLLNTGSGTLTLQGNGGLYIFANMSGSANIVQNDNSSVIWNGANTYSGNYTANVNSTVYLWNSLALGNITNQMTLNANSKVMLDYGVNVTNQSLTINSASSPAVWTYGGSTNSWTSSFTLSTVAGVQVDTNCSLSLNGSIGSTGGIIKSGPGVLAYIGSTANTYSGPTTVNDGTLLLSKSAGNGGVVGSTLTIGDGTGAADSAVVRNLVTSQISATPDITINSDGLLDINSITEAVGNSLTINGGDIQTGTASLNLAANAAITNSGSSQIYGALNIGSGTCTIAGSGFLYFYASVSGSANIVKNGSVSLMLENANTFSGTLTANISGYLWLADPQALGGTNGGTILNDITHVYFFSDYNFTNESLTLNSSYSPTIYVYSGSTNVWSATNITLLANATIQVATNAALELNAPIGGAGGITKIGPGRLIYSGATANTYAGLTTVNEGELDLNKSGSTQAIPIASAGLVIGDGIGTDIVRNFSTQQIWGFAPVTITNSGTWDINGYQDGANPLILNAGHITTGTGFYAAINTVKVGGGGSSFITGNLRLDNASVVFSNSADLYLNASVFGFSAAYGFAKAGTASLYLQTSNSYSGTTVVREGYLHLGDNGALGGTSSGTIVSNGATLVLDGNVCITNESLTLNGPGISSVWGALDVENGVHTWAGPITLNANSTFDSWGGGSELHINGPITGAGGLELFNSGAGGGVIYFDGSSANSYAGTTTVDTGCTLTLNKSGFDNAVPNDLTINGTVQLMADNQINNNANILVNGTGLFNLNGNLERFNALSGSGNMQFGAGGYAIPGHAGASSTFNGIASGDGYIWKVGSGVLTLNGNNTYLRQTLVDVGMLVVNGDQHQSAVAITAGATLGGNGFVGNITAGGGIAPGNSAGMLSCSNLTFAGTGGYYVELTGPTAGTDYDQINVHGASSLANATLSVTPAFVKSVGLGQQFVIITNDLADPISGTFNGLAEGATLTAGGYKFSVSYAGGSGNDVVLTLIGTPAAAANSIVASGNGDRYFSPNECSTLLLAITNSSGTAMTGISATLASADPNVIVTQPASTYPNVPASGQGTNTLAFQVSTLSSLPCATNFVLNLTLSTASHGVFTVPVYLTSGAPAAVPARFDNNTAAAIPDPGTLDSTITVAGFTTPLEKVAVSLWITHPSDSDLSLSLIAPDGTTVPLTMNIGSGANFGSGSSDASRTVFDDAAAVSITAGSPPFVGTFRPQGVLGNFFWNSTPNGTWKLRVADGFGGLSGTLRNWSLFLYGTQCPDGGGACALCSGGMTLTNTLNTGSSLTPRIVRDGSPSTCGVAKAFPGIYGGSYYYNAFPFYNTTSNNCITVTLTSLSGGDLMSSAYLSVFNPANVAANYAADSGNSTAGSGPVTFSFNPPPNSIFVVVVNSVASVGDYTLSVSGGDCPPVVGITPASANNVDVAWPTVAGGYALESKPSLVTGPWSGITNEPVATSNRFHVVNSASSTNRFYRLHKP